MTCRHSNRGDKAAVTASSTASQVEPRPGVVRAERPQPGLHRPPDGRPLRVAVDARAIFDAVPRGIAKTMIALYRAMARVRPDWRFWMFYQRGVAEAPFADTRTITCSKIDIPGDRFNCWQALRLPVAGRLARADVLHCHAGVAPPFPLLPLVVTIHDLIPLDTRADEPNVIRWGKNVRRAASNARYILTASEDAKRRIVHHFKAPERKIRIVHWGTSLVRPEPLSPAGAAQVRLRNGLPPDRPYVLHFGMGDPRKNTARLIEAWGQLPQGLRRSYFLLVVGVQGPALAGLNESVRALGLSESVKVNSYAPEQDLPLLLSEAEVLAYPTLSEGFGLPVLDAFASGTAVLTSLTSSLPEVAGDAALLIDPYDLQAIRHGLERLLTDERLRAALVERGRNRVTAFSWDRCAEQVAEVLAAAATTSRGPQ